MFSGGSEVSIETFDLKPSLWKLITSVCPSNEADEIKRILGASLVEQACDLYEEASTLLDIWQIAREDTDAEINHHHNSSSRLPEPPSMREHLLQEIRFFIDYLKEKNEKRYSSKSGSLNRNGSSEDVLDYVTKTRVKRGTEVSGVRGTSCGNSGSGGSSRPMSGVSSRDGRETPMRVVTPSDEGSQLSVLSDGMEAIDEHVNATDIDQVVEHLRCVLSEECDQRRDDIDFLQRCLDEEQEFRTSVSKPEPTLKELRDFSSQLEKEILEGSKSTPPPTLTSPTHPRPPLLPAIPHPPPTQNSHQRTFNRASKVKGKTPTRIKSSDKNIPTGTTSLSDQSDTVNYQDRLISQTRSSPQSRRSLINFPPATSLCLNNSPCTRVNTHHENTHRGSSALVYTSVDQESMCTMYSRSAKSRGVQSTCTCTSPSSYGKPIT